MRLARLLSLAIPVAALGLTPARDASACGGCFVQQTESTQVTGHRMILSVSPTSTTLWDQITYSGNPAEFAWVLPIKDKVEIGLSSDALFSTLEALTQVVVNSPQITCPPPPSCGGDFAAGAAEDGGGGANSGEPPVEVIAQEVVGPYETVQLKSDDPDALKNWLLSHNYNVPDDIAPVVDAYVNEGFGFLALKLVPGEGVDSMRPVRITTNGASPVLPLRMVAAGTGAVTPITLWVLGEGRYVPSSFPTFMIHQEDLVWDWDAQSSNYKALRAAGFEASEGKAWLLEAGEPVSSYGIEYPLQDLVQYSPLESGYGDETGQGAQDELVADLEKLYGGIDLDSLAVARMYGELSRKALATDLALEASADQSYVQRWFETPNSVGTPPACPEFDPCEDDAWGGNDDGSSGGGVWDDIWGGGSPDHEGAEPTGGGGCAVRGSGSQGPLLGVALVAGALALARRRRSRG